MAAQGYIGRVPGDSSVIVARQTFTPTGITTNFTFASGYDVGYVDAYLNGARLVEGDDYTATDGSVVGLTTHAINGDVLELVVYKAFNLANVTGANGDFIIPDKIVHKEDLDTAIRFPQADTFTVETAGSEVIRIDANSNVGIGTTNTLKAADPKNQSGLNVGFITANSITATAGSFGTLNVSGTLTFEDVANQNVVGFATFQKGIIVQGAGSTTTTLNVTGVSTMTGDANFGAALNILDAITHVGDTNTKIRFPANDTFTVETSGSERLRVDSLGEVRVGSAFSVSQAGVVTATSFFGSGAGLTGVASTDNINTSTLAQFTGGVGIADSIFHIGDSNNAIRFPAADTFTVTTAGNERLRVTSAGIVTVASGGSLAIPAVPGTNTNANMSVLFQSTTGLVDGGSGLLYNPAEDALKVNGNVISSQEFRGSGDDVKITAANSSSTSFFFIDGGEPKIQMATDKVLAFSGSIGEIGSVTGFQATNTAASSNTDFGIRATTIRFATGNSERIRIGASGQIGIAGANFGTSGQVLTSGGASGTVTWEDASSGGITTTAYSPAANAIIQIGLGTARHHELTLSAGFTTVTTTGGVFGESHSLVLIQPSSGICTVGFSTFFKFPSGSTPEMSEGSSKIDLVSFVVKNIARNVGTGATELLASAGLNYS